MAIGRRRGGKSVGKCLKERCTDRPGVVKQRHRSERKRRECGCSIFSAPTVVFAVSSFIYVLPPRFYYISWKFFAIYPSLDSSLREMLQEYCELTSVSFSLDEKKDSFVFFPFSLSFPHSLRRHCDWKIIILLSMEFAIFLYTLSISCPRLKIVCVAIPRFIECNFRG